MEITTQETSSQLRGDDFCGSSAYHIGPLDPLKALHSALGRHTWSSGSKSVRGPSSTFKLRGSDPWDHGPHRDHMVHTGTTWSTPGPQGSHRDHMVHTGTTWSTPGPNGPLPQEGYLSIVSVTANPGRPDIRLALAGHWLAPDLRCSKTPCGTPVPIRVMLVNSLNLVGSKAKAYCYLS